MRRLTIAAAIVALGALVFAGGAQACSCAQMAPGEALRQADAAIAGNLIEVVERNRYRADYRYRVQRVFEGGQGIRVGGTIVVRSGRDSAACGLPAGIGRTYGLLLSRGRGRWAGGLCGVFEPRRLESASRRGPLRDDGEGKDGCAS